MASSGVGSIGLHRGKPCRSHHASRNGRVLHLGLGGCGHVYGCSREKGSRGTTIVLHSRTMRLSFLRAGKLNRWCAPITIISAIRSCWLMARGSQANQHGHAIWTRSKTEVRGAAKEFSGMFLDPYGPALPIHYRAEGTMNIRFSYMCQRSGPCVSYDPKRRAAERSM